MYYEWNSEFIKPHASEADIVEACRRQILKAMQILDPQATRADLLESCRRLFMGSDVFIPYDLYPNGKFVSDEVDIVAKAILLYIENPALGWNDHSIVFSVHREQLGLLKREPIGYGEFAAMHSEDMLFESVSKEWASFDLDDLRHHLQTFLVAILYRYRYCVTSEIHAFPLSWIFYYLDCVKELLSREQRESDASAALETTLGALVYLDITPSADVADMFDKLPAEKKEIEEGGA